MPSYFPILIVVGLILLMGGIGYLAYLAEKKRTEAWRHAAEELGFQFQATGSSILLRFPGFHLFSQGRNHTVKNLLQGKTADLDVAIFDYSYTTGSGKNRKTWHQTVIAFEFDEPQLPGFSLRPESIFHKIGQWFGYRDMNFDTHPRFSKQYVLRGENEDAVRERFPDHVLEYYEGTTGVCTEASGGRLVHYRATTRQPPEKARELLEEGFEVLALFRPRQGKAST
jgi:hypothetical protein